MTPGQKIEVPFLFYVKGGECKSNLDMPTSAEGFFGWLSAASVIRRQDRHKNRDVEAALAALREFTEGLSSKEEIREKDLLSFI